MSRSIGKAGLILFCWAASGCLSEPARDRQPGKPAPLLFGNPSITKLYQQNVDGTEVKWIEESKETRILLQGDYQIHGDEGYSCFRSGLNIEFRDAAESFTYRANYPDQAERNCDATGTCQVRSNRVLIEGLAPGRPYKWQAQAYTKLYWRHSHNGRRSCGAYVETRTSQWGQIGLPAPGYLSFRTPKSFSDRRASAYAVRPVLGAIQGGSVQSTEEDDNRFLVIAAAGTRRAVELEYRVAIETVRLNKDFSWTVQARSTRACAGSAEVWNRRTNSWQMLGADPVGTADVTFSRLVPPDSPRDYLLPDSRPGAPPRGTAELLGRFRCGRTDTRAFNLSLDLIRLDYRQADQ